MNIFVLFLALLFGVVSCSGGGSKPNTPATVVESLQDKVEKEDLSGVITTPLPLVYKRGNEFYTLGGFDPKRKSELWGFALKSGVFLELAYKNEPLEKKTFNAVKHFAGSMSYKGKNGDVPRENIYKNNWGRAERQAMEDIATLLASHGIVAEPYAKNHIIWFSETGNFTTSPYMVLSTAEGGLYSKSDVPFVAGSNNKFHYMVRVAVVY